MPAHLQWRPRRRRRIHLRPPHLAHIRPRRRQAWRQRQQSAPMPKLLSSNRNARIQNRRARRWNKGQSNKHLPDSPAVIPTSGRELSDYLAPAGEVRKAEIEHRDAGAAGENKLLEGESNVATSILPDGVGDGRPGTRPTPWQNRPARRIRPQRTRLCLTRMTSAPGEAVAPKPDRRRVRQSRWRMRQPPSVRPRFHSALTLSAARWEAQPRPRLAPRHNCQRGRRSLHRCRDRRRELGALRAKSGFAHSAVIRADSKNACDQANHSTGVASSMTSKNWPSEVTSPAGTVEASPRRERDIAFSLHP